MSENVRCQHMINSSIFHADILAMESIKCDLGRECERAHTRERAHPQHFSNAFNDTLVITIERKTPGVQLSKMDKENE